LDEVGGNEFFRYLGNHPMKGIAIKRTIIWTTQKELSVNDV
jgi:hypothetical protein